MENRNYIIDRLKSKSVSIGEFNYDKLSAPPIAALFTPFDIAQLNKIAKSLKYSAKPQIKYQEIDNIMRRRGFAKLVAGTNRVVYRFVEDNSFVVKVAADAVGLGDNPKEFRNQLLFKPFVTKCFEITPCGTLGVFERVNPITSREEFMSVSSDIFEVINDWFIGEYIMEDIGTKYFMNWGVRPGFGPVLLDYPYVYKLDGNKLYCNAPSMNSPSGKCEGVIDYDPGYNFLYCTKCGVIYKAKELEEAVKENNVIVKSEGGFKMKVAVKRGNVVEKRIETGEYASSAKVMPAKPIKGRNERLSNTKMKDEKKEVIEEKVVAKEEVKEEKKVVVSPITIDETLIKKKTVNGSDYSESSKEEDKVKAISNHLDKIVKLLDEIEDKEEKYEVKKMIGDKLCKEICFTVADKEEIIDKLSKDVCITADDSEKVDDDAVIANFMKNHEISFMANEFTSSEDEEFDGIMVKLTPVIKTIDPETEEVITEQAGIGDEIFLGIPADIAIKILKESGYELANKTGTKYNKPKYFAASITNVKDIFEDEQPCRIITIIDKDGNYLTVDNDNIVAIDVIDDRSVESVSVVSSKWLNSVIERLNDSGVSSPDDEDDKEKVTEETTSEKEMPTGVLPPNLSVNGVATVEE